MIIKQENESPVSDLFDKLHIQTAFDGITKQAGDLALDSDLLKVYCEETIKLLKDFSNGITAIEKKIQKQTNQEIFRQNLFGRDSIG